MVSLSNYGRPFDRLRANGFTGPVVRALASACRHRDWAGGLVRAGKLGLDWRRIIVFLIAAIAYIMMRVGEMALHRGVGASQMLVFAVRLQKVLYILFFVMGTLFMVLGLLGVEG